MLFIFLKAGRYHTHTGRPAGILPHGPNISMCRVNQHNDSKKFLKAGIYHTHRQAGGDLPHAPNIPMSRVNQPNDSKNDHVVSILEGGEGRSSTTCDESARPRAAAAAAACGSPDAPTSSPVAMRRRGQRTVYASARVASKKSAA